MVVKRALFQPRQYVEAPTVLDFPNEHMARRQQLAMRFEVEDRKALILQVVDTLRSPRGFAGSMYGREEKTHKKSNDRNDNKQLHQSESARAYAPSSFVRFANSIYHGSTQRFLLTPSLQVGRDAHELTMLLLNLTPTSILPNGEVTRNATGMIRLTRALSLLFANAVTISNYLTLHWGRVPNANCMA
jgi:hypothetical protein